MQNQEKIIQAIAAYLEENTAHNNGFGQGEWVEFISSLSTFNHVSFCKQIATEIATAIAPHLEAGAGWEDAPEWANYKTKDPDGSVFFWELEPQKKEDFWSQNANGGRFIVIGVDSWEELHQRPG